jgi:hypothetical protein
MRFWKFVGVLVLGSAGLPASAADRACDEFYARLPNVSWALCQSAQLQASSARSVRGRTLYLAEVKPETPASLRVLVLGGIHGDELSSSSLALHWIRLAQSDPQRIHWRFLPATNPDGLFDKPARRMNAHGVDLNRNFPTPNWHQDAPRYWEVRTHKDPRRWPGPSPLSEPESRFIFDQITEFKPDLVVSIHAPYGLLDFDGPHDPPQRLGRLYLDRVGVYPGSLGNYGGVQNGVPVVTIELPNALLTPRNVEIQRMWQDLRQWMGVTLARAGEGATTTR